MKCPSLSGPLYALARPLLFTMDPEEAHEFTLRSIDQAARTGALRLVCGEVVDDPVEVMGLRFRNRVGLAAGLDKNGAHVDALSQLGFGFIEVGTVTPRAQPGNPKPRMFRLPEHLALINRMGFNNQGVDAFAANVERCRYDGILGLNIGKNADTPIERALDDYLHCLERVYPHASYVTVNISSPNTKNLRSLQGASELDPFLGALRDARARLADRHGRRVPLALKIAPDLETDSLRTICDALVRFGIDCVIATNTTIERKLVAGSRHASETGGLSGRPLAQASNAVISALRAALPDDYPIIGVGGILGAEDAAAKIAAGATLVQLYTGLIYRGPGLVSACARALREASAKENRLAAGVTRA